MRRRLYFMVSDVARARRIRDELLLARTEHGHIHVPAQDGIPLEGWQETTVLQKSDFVHGAETGLAVGGGIGVPAGLTALLFPRAGVNPRPVAVPAFP